VPLVIAGGDEVIGRFTLSGVTRGALQSAAVGYTLIRTDRRHPLRPERGTGHPRSRTKRRAPSVAAEVSAPSSAPATLP
jgi:hypothetical protein